MILETTLATLLAASLRTGDESVDDDVMTRFNLLIGMGNLVEAWAGWLNAKMREGPATWSGYRNPIFESIGFMMGEQVANSKTLEEARDNLVQLMALVLGYATLREEGAGKVSKQDLERENARTFHDFVEIPRHFHGMTTPYQTQRVIPIFGQKILPGSYGERATKPFGYQWFDHKGTTYRVLSWDTSDPGNARVLVAVGSPVVTTHLEIKTFVPPKDWLDHGYSATPQGWSVEELRTAIASW